MKQMLWIKLSTDIFDDEAIRLIDDMPEADAIINIWFRILVLAGKKCSDGVMVFNDRMPYTDEMFSTLFRRPVQTVRLALAVLERFGLIEVVNDTYTIPKWSDYQGSEKIEAARKSHAEAQKRYREKQKQKALSTGQGSVTSRVISPVTQSDNAEVEEEVEVDKTIMSGKPDNTPYKEVIDYLNERVGTRYKHTTKKTRTLIKARFKEGFTLEDFKTVIDNQCEAWLKDGSMSQYLRPETLFSPKFEGYLNRKERRKASDPVVKERAAVLPCPFCGADSEHRVGVLYECPNDGMWQSND